MLSDCQNLNQLTGYRARRERSWRDFVHAQRAAWSLTQGLKLEARVVLSADAGLLVLSLTVEALQGKMCQNSLPSEVGRSLGAKFSRGTGHPWGIFFGFYKTRHILLSNGANCTVLRAVVLTQYQCVTDRQTDGIAVANTALAMRALRAL